jgi:hypothetical protein
MENKKSLSKLSNNEPKGITTHMMKDFSLEELKGYLKKQQLEELSDDEFFSILVLIQEKKALDPRFPEYYIRESKKYENNIDRIKVLQKAIELFPDNEKILALYYNSKGHLEEINNNLDPRFPDYYIKESKKYENHIDRIKVLQKAIELFPDHKEILALYYNSKGHLEKLNKNYDKAMEYYNKALDYVPDLFYPNYYLGMYYDGKNPEISAKYLDSAIESWWHYCYKPDDPDNEQYSDDENLLHHLYETRARIYFDKKQYEECLDVYLQMPYPDGYLIKNFFKKLYEKKEFKVMADLLKNKDLYFMYAILYDKAYEYEEDEEFLAFHNGFNEGIKLTSEEKKEIEINATIKEQRKSKEKLENMIQQYTHTLANTLFPDTIYEVAQKLKKHSEYKKDAMILSDAYQAELFMKHQGQLLAIRNTLNEASFQSFIRGDRLDNGTNIEAASIEDILAQSLERVMSRFLNDDYHKLDSIRKALSEQLQTKLETWKDRFEKEVFFEEQNIISWVNQHFIPLKITIAESWKNIRLRKNKYASSLLQGYFSELLFNALKYRKVNSEYWVEIGFTDEVIENETYLVVTFQNQYSAGKNISISSGKGLISIKSDLEMLNEKSDENRTLKIEQKNANFTVKLVFKKDLFILPPPIKVNLKNLKK